MLSELHIRRYDRADLDFEFGDRQVIALVGDNGSGKTCVLDAIAFLLGNYGLRHKLYGTVDGRVFDGGDPYRARLDVREISERRAESHNPWEEWPDAMRSQRLIDAWASLGVQPLHERIGCGHRALLTMLAQLVVDPTPSYAVIDQPEMGLHPRHHGTVMTTIRELAPGAQIFVATHSPDLLDAIGADNVWVMPLGRRLVEHPAYHELEVSFGTPKAGEFWRRTWGEEWPR